MIERTLRGGDDALPLVVSPIIPSTFRHGFTTRHGGVSPAPFDSLNLGLKWGDAREAVLENRRRLLSVSGVRTMLWARQVHGATVLVVGASDARDAVAATDADALCSAADDVAVAVYVSDCVPVLVADPRTGAFGAAHAGWRGTVAGVVPRLITTMADAFGSRPADLAVALGPAIGPCCFEVGPEVVDAFRTAFAAVPGARGGDALVRDVGAGARPHIDLFAANALLAEAAGVAPDRIDREGPCTRCGADRFFSYRRDQARTGQHVGFIARATLGATWPGP